MGLHNMGFYTKNGTADSVVIFEDVDIFGDKEKDAIAEEIIKVINTRISASCNEHDYELLCEVLSKYNIPKEKREELQGLFGCNIRYGVLD